MKHPPIPALLAYEALSPSEYVSSYVTTVVRAVSYKNCPMICYQPCLLAAWDKVRTGVSLQLSHPMCGMPFSDSHAVLETWSQTFRITVCLHERPVTSLLQRSQRHDLVERDLLAPVRA